MLRQGWTAALLALAVGCGGKDDSGAAAGTTDAVNCVAADMSDPNCESAQAVLRLSVTSGGQPAPAGLTVSARDCDGIETTSTTDDLGEVRLNLPATTYLIEGRDAATEATLASETHDLPGCQTTSLTIEI